MSKDNEEEITNGAAKTNAGDGPELTDRLVIR